MYRIDISKQRLQAALEAAHRQVQAIDAENRAAMRQQRENGRAQYFVTAMLDSGLDCDPVTYALQQARAAGEAIRQAHDELAHGSAQVAQETLRAYIDEWV